MKKVLIALVISAACFGCGGNTSGDGKPISTNDENKNSQIGGEASSADTGTTPAATPATTPETAAAAPGKDGKALIEGSDCRTCHKDNEKLIGPAYAEVAKKYDATPDNIEKLTEKVMKGGQGVWGDLPMAAHPNLAKEDAEAMVKYILSMK